MHELKFVREGKTPTISNHTKNSKITKPTAIVDMNWYYQYHHEFDSKGQGWSMLKLLSKILTEIQSFVKPNIAILPVIVTTQSLDIELVTSCSTNHFFP